MESARHVYALRSQGGTRLRLLSGVMASGNPRGIARAAMAYAKVMLSYKHALSSGRNEDVVYVGTDYSQ